MAKIISNSTDLTQTADATYSVWKIALMGVILGIIYIFLGIIFKNFFSVEVAGNLAMIFVAIIGVIFMILLRVLQPLITAVAVGVALWGLFGLADGLGWFEAIVWASVLFSATYVLFSWVINNTRLTYALVAITLIIIAARVAISL